MMYAIGDKVELTSAHGYDLPVPIPGVISALHAESAEVTHDAHDCDPHLPKGTMGFDFWPYGEFRKVVD